MTTKTFSAVAAALATVAVIAGVVQLGATSSGAAAPHLAVGSGLSVRNHHLPQVPTPVSSPIHSSPVSSPTSTPSSGAPTMPSSTAPTPTSSTPSAGAAAKPFLGTLVTHGKTAAQESSAGLKMAMLEFSWSSFEPSEGVFNTSYANSQAALLKQYLAAGMKVTLGLGLHYTPSWALNIAGSRMIDEYGNQSSQIDLVFNQSMRNLAQAYLAAVNKAVGLQNFWAVRITSGGMSELLYPSGNYWAYSAGAQNGATMPAGMAANPMPGWRPGQSATASQRQSWTAWYLAALDNVADWQMSVVSALGFNGYFQIITPGQGLRPGQLAAQVNNGLTDGLLGRGAVWDLVYGGLKHRTNITAYVSSVADGSGSNDSCAASDDTVSAGSSTAYYWSATRWISYLARKNGFTVAGEVPGYPSSGSVAQAHYSDPSSSGLLATAMTQARSCGFLGLYWAHDDQVWNGAMPLSELSSQTSSSAAAPANAS